jgi:hypothetical protein
MHTADGHRRALAAGSCPKWSPDGKQLAYLDENGELILLEVATGAKRKPVPGHKLVGGCIEWSPDMRLLSLCFLPDRQPDPNRYVSYVGVLNLRDGTYRRFDKMVWGYSPNFRWIKTEDGGI